MPFRKTPFVSGEIYHVFNRSIARQPIFLTKRDHQRSTETINYYRYHKLPSRFSHFNRLSNDLKEQYTKTYMENNKPMLDILAYSIMPNHIHFLIKQLLSNSISEFMRNFQHSYSKYFNTKRDRSGSLFQAMFKAIRIESDEQLIHVSRYIHLNPITSHIIKKQEIAGYSWSSFKDYITPSKHSFINTSIIMEHFKSIREYKEFVFDHADYQKKLAMIEHLLLN